MAMADYRLCDLCEKKAFYDSNLNYEFDGDLPESECIRNWHGVRLDYVGDWVVLCRECAKTHMCIIMKKEDVEVMEKLP